MTVGRSSEPRLRVLWLIKGLGPGGAEHLLVEHARVLDPSEFDVDVAYVVGYKSDLVPRLPESMAPVALGGRTGRDVRWPLRLVRLIRSRRYDVVHAHSPSTAAILRALKPLLKRTAIVYTEHGRWASYRLPTRLANAWTYRQNDEVIAVSSDAAASIPAPLSGRTQVLDHGVNIDGVRATADRSGVRRELGVAADDVLIGTVANLRVEKDPATFVRGVAEAVSRDGFDRVTWVHVGQGPIADEVHHLAEVLGVQHRIRFLGGRSDARRLISGFDVFTLTSAHEGLPVALMEAFSHGIAVVATDVGGMSAAVADVGILVPPTDPVALADGWEMLVSDPTTRARLADRSAAHADRFDIRHAASAIEASWRRAARRRHRGDS